MSGIRPTEGTIGAAAYHWAPSRDENRLEPFFWKLLCLSALAYFVWSDTISIGIGPLSIQKTDIQRHLAHQKTDFFTLMGFYDEKRAVILLDEADLDNLSFAIDPTCAERYGIGEAQVQEHMQRCSLFVKHFSPVAIAEMRRYGVPASILLAQALLASNAGANEMAVKTNNFFQRVCQSTHCNAIHFTDPDVDDPAMQVDAFSNLWESFRAQSLFLRRTAPYSSLFQLGRKDYKSWAEGLAAGGYSPDEQYGGKLLAIIQSLHLEAFDQR